MATKKKQAKADQPMHLPKNVEALWTFEQVQEFTKIPVRTLKLYVASKDIPSYKLGRLRRFDPTKIRKWLESKAS